MSYDLQNFYKSTLSLDWSTGTGNFYVTTKPTISTGWLVTSPNNSTTREIIKYTSTGTDTNGDYVVVSERGVGGTTEQTHTVGEPIRMNITAEYWDAMNDDIAAIVASGVSNANTTTMGGVEIATDAEVDAGTATGGTGASIVLTPANVNASHNIPFVAPGTSGNLMTSNGTDWTSTTLVSLLPTPAFYQRVAVPSVTTNTMYGCTSNTDGSVLVVMESTATLKRFARDTNTGVYIQTASVTVTSGSSFSSICILGSYVYVFIDSGNNVICYRYDIADLANQTAMTIPAIDTAGSNYQVSSWTDGTYIYVMSSKANTTAYKLSVSGTTFTTVTTGTTAASSSSDGNWMFDGTNIYQFSFIDGDNTIKKASDVFLSAFTTTTKTFSAEIDATISGDMIINIDTTRIYVGYQIDSYDETAARKQIIVLLPVTKP